jgi:hypothetical protein
MKQVLSLTILFCGLVFAAAAHALPDEYLQKDYDTCMGGEPTTKDPLRAQFCQCVREDMRSWTADQYAAVATEAQKSTAPPPAVAALAQKCMAQVQHM